METANPLHINKPLWHPALIKLEFSNSKFGMTRSEYLNVLHSAVISTLNMHKHYLCMLYS